MQIDQLKTDRLAALERVAASITLPAAPPPVHSGPRKVARVLYLPVEVAARELPAKARLAGEMARRGFQVVLGATWNLTAFEYRDLHPGIVLFKTLNSLDAVNMGRAHKAGHLAAVLNEEFFSLSTDPWLYRVECNPGAMALADLICAQGEKSAALMRGLTKAEIAVTGNPRGLPHRILRGDEILVCTMAGTINGLLPFDEYMAMSFKVLGRIDDDTTRLMREQIAHECDGLALLVPTLNKLAQAFPTRRIRLRPHPVENPAAYSASGNIVVDDRTPFSERLRNAAVVVFISGCGTGLEAFLAGIPGVRLGRGGHGISMDLHREALTPDDAIAAVAQQLEKPELIGSLEGHFAPDTLADALDLFQQKHASGAETDVVAAWKKRRGNVEPQEFLLNKFPDTSAAQIAQLTDARVTELTWNTWLVGSNRF
jgi:hypothetical protein